MDSPFATARSPPPFCKQVVQDAVQRYRDLSKQLTSKTRVLAKLRSTVPKSLRQKMTLNVSAVMREHSAQEAEAIEKSFNDVLAAREEELREVVLRSTEAHIATLKRLLDAIPSDAKSKLRDYFMRVHVELFPDDQYEFDEHLDFDDGSSATWAVADCRLAEAFLSEQLAKERYALILQSAEQEMRAEEREQRQTAASTMEFDTPSNELVAQLVKRSIAKETSKLNKEINVLRAQLNQQARPRDAKPGQAKAQRKGKKKQPRQDGGRADGQQPAPNAKRHGPKPKPKPNAGKRGPRKTQN